MADPFFIAPADLHPILHGRDAPVILDLRDAEDFASDPRLIPCAVLSTLEAIEAFRPTGPVICTCQKGGKLSQLAAAGLRARAFDARSLAGGHLDWCEAGLPLVSAAARRARWVMPLDPGWDGIAALWTLRRLVDRTVPVRAVERDWLPKAVEIWDAALLPSEPNALARDFGLAHPLLPRLSGGPDALVAGRLTRTDPEGALDLVDDWLARPEAAA